MVRDRLYGITLYLLSHQRASAQELADHFEVSRRCIQRDIDRLSMAGVPVIAYPGVKGGYELQEGYRMNAQLATKEEYAILAASLQGMQRADEGMKVDILDKIDALSKQEYPIQLDFSIAQEQELVQDHKRLIKEAIQNETMICFSYTNANNETKPYAIEPVAMLYRWYAWYLIGYDDKREDYYMFKLIRMRGPIMQGKIEHSHPPLSEILNHMDQRDERSYTEVILRCQPQTRARVMEYLPGEVQETYADGSFLYRIKVVQEEYFWYASLMGMSDTVQVIQPTSLQERILADCKRMIKLYETVT